MLLSVTKWALIVSLWLTAFNMDIPTLEDKGNDTGQEGVEEELEKKKEREEEKGMMNQAKAVSHRRLAFKPLTCASLS